MEENGLLYLDHEQIRSIKESKNLILSREGNVDADVVQKMKWMSLSGGLCGKCLPNKLKWVGHIKRRPDDYMVRKMFRSKSRPQKQEDQK